MNFFRKTALVILFSYVLLYSAQNSKAECLTGAFISDSPTQKDIINFKNNYGKKPYLVMVFIDWNHFVDKKIIEDVYTQNCTLIVTWEPWNFVSKEPIDYDQLLTGKYDQYIAEFANKLKTINKDVFLRFSHEMNGDWYPWAGVKIGKEKYIAIHRHVKDIFNKEGVTNVKWIFSVNWEDVPKENNYFALYYPGNQYVDYIGIDGYNWGNTQKWSKWISFNDIFYKRYNEIVQNFNKPVIISEFGCAPSGGNKALWIKEALNNIKDMKSIKAFILFNINKETDWFFSPDSEEGIEFKNQLEDKYFKSFK